MYNIQQTIGAFYEDLLAKLFALERIDKNFSHKTPDLRGKGFYLESKASRYDNGGVIKGWQLEDLREIGCPYAFPFHELRTPVRRYYPTERSLLRALAANPFRSIYIFPFSVVEACYKNNSRRPYRNTGDNFTQIRESLARDVFNGELNVWKKLHLNFENFPTASPDKNIFIVSDDKSILGNLLKRYSKQ